MAQEALEVGIRGNEPRAPASHVNGRGGKHAVVPVHLGADLHGAELVPNALPEGWVRTGAQTHEKRAMGPWADDGPHVVTREDHGGRRLGDLGYDLDRGGGGVRVGGSVMPVCGDDGERVPCAIRGVRTISCRGV